MHLNGVDHAAWTGAGVGGALSETPPATISGELLSSDDYRVNG